MPARRLRFRPAIPAVVVLLALAVFGAQPARAGLFDDEEARKQIDALTLRLNERVDTVSKAQIDLVNQIQALREDNAKLRGQVEMLQYELESAKKRQQDFYVDLDGRIRKLETTISAVRISPAGEGDASSPTGAAGAPAADETREYEAALNLFKANKIRESAAAFETFAKTYPDSALTPNAHYWQGNALTALRDCKRAIEVYRVVAARWPQNPRAADALLGAASCQQDLGDARGARATLEALLAQYPESPVAATARQRLKK
ncbi:MAG: tol-pal system protein YbgF [Candidatus Accumulibacter sp.]|jgi:tol-pal system protein YbgF|nr:tol-pal system protein YbgF [Accumulibacter sp.]